MTHKLVQVGLIGVLMCSLMACPVTPPTPPPASPTSVKAMASGEMAIGVTWNVVATATGYILERKLGTGSYARLATPTGATYNDSALLSGTYTYRVSATNSDGQSGGTESNAVTITSDTAPLAPGNFVATKASATTISLSWNTSSGATQYVLQRQIDSGAFTAVASLSTTTYTDAELANGQYVYRITATNTIGSSPAVESPAVSVAISRVVLNTDFDGTLLTEISPGTALLEGVQNFAGLGAGGVVFANQFLRSATANTVTVTLTNLPKHTSINLGFLLAAIDSLDGTGTFPSGDFLNVSLDGTSVFRESFANATNSQIQSYMPPAGGELARRQELGFQVGGYYLDSAYNMNLEPKFNAIGHTGSTAQFTFLIEGEGVQTLDDESWAMDNLQISINP